jgi:hypothetical protein
MSTLTGHREVTAQAVRELSAEWPNSPLLRNLDSAGLPSSVVQRDIIDVLILGHWADFGQKHHFMRKFDGQSPYQAYVDAVEWIRSNALEAAQTLAKRVARHFPQGIKNVPGTDPRGRSVLGGTVVQTPRGPVVADAPSWQALGNAVHALEDSFAPGHAVRGEPLSATTPGAIEHIKRYAGDEKKGHEEGDAVWKAGPGQLAGFSRDGRFAINATKQLILMVISSAVGERGRPPQALAGWEGFKEQWLKASPKLSRETDAAFELIDRFYSGVRLGAKNIKTVSMDEEGLAQALVQEVGTNTSLALRVFVRLDEHYNSDADDVAEIYVNEVRRRGGALLASVRGNRELVQRLIKVMGEGWTSGGEKDCIKFLRGLL